MRKQYLITGRNLRTMRRKKGILFCLTVKKWLLGGKNAEFAEFKDTYNLLA